jgi:hypothetical protein
MGLKALEMMLIQALTSMAAEAHLRLWSLSIEKYKNKDLTLLEIHLCNIIPLLLEEIH